MTMALEAILGNIVNHLKGLSSSSTGRKRPVINNRDLIEAQLAPFA